MRGFAILCIKLFYYYPYFFLVIFTSITHTHLFGMMRVPTAVAAAAAAELLTVIEQDNHNVAAIMMLQQYPQYRPPLTAPGVEFSLE